MDLTVLANEAALYEQRRKEFEQRHMLEWVVIRGKDVTFFENFDGAAQSAVERFGRGPYLIRQIGAQIRPLPASFAFRSINAPS